MKPTSFAAAAAAVMMLCAAGPHEETFPSTAGETDAAMTPAAWSPFCSKCERERADLKVDLKGEIESHEALKDSSRVLRDGFGYIRIDWVKAALFNAGHYDSTAVRIDGYDATIKSLEYNRLTIDAAKRFQCAFYEEAADGGCDTALSTGWITFLEARSSICEQGFLAKDETAFVLAEWYAYGRVFEQDLAYAFHLVKTYQDSLNAQIAAESNVQQKDYLKKLNNDARALRQFVDRIIHERAKASGHTTQAELDAMHGIGVTFDKSVICPRQA